jgi:hypothetical protein
MAILPTRATPTQFAAGAIFALETFGSIAAAAACHSFGIPAGHGRAATEPGEPGPFGANGFTLEVFGGFR